MTISGFARPTRMRGAIAAFTGMLARASSQLATVVVTLFATRFLNPSDFGVFALGTLAITLIRTFLHTGAFEYLLKGDDAQSCSSEALAANMILAIGLSVVLGLAALGSNAIFGFSTVMSIMLMLLPSNLIAAAGAWREALLLRTGRLSLYYGLTTATELIAAGLAVVLLFHGFAVYALICQVYARNILLLGCYLSTGRAILSKHFDVSVLRHISRWSLSRYASVLLGFGGNYGVDVLLGVFLSPAATGLYRASNRLITAVSDIFTQPIKMFAMTTFSSRAASGQPSNALWPAMIALTGAGGGAVLAGLAVVAHQIVPLVLGDRWTRAATLLPLLAVIRAVSLIDTVTGALLVALNQQRTVLRIQIFVSVIGTVLFVCAAPFGLLPAILAMAATALQGSTAMMVATFRVVRPAGADYKTFLLVALSPAIATVAGALFAQKMAVAEQVRPAHAVVFAIGAGVAAWSLILLLLRRKLTQVITLLNPE